MDRPTTGPVVTSPVWSTVEASLINVTLYDRAAARLRFRQATPSTLAHPAVVEAAKMLGLTPARR